MNRILLIVAMALLPLVSVSQVLTFQEAHLDDLNGVDGIDAAYGIAVSPDSADVYVSGSLDKAVAHFSRNTTTGNLTFVQAYIDTSQGGTIPGLDGARRMAISPDGVHLYVTATNSDAIVVFSRNAGTGALSHVQTLVDGAGGVDALDGAIAAQVSSDGNFVYVVAEAEDAISVFTRNTGTGMLTQLQAISDTTAGIDGLNGANALVLSPNNDFIYATGSSDDGLSVFSRDAVTGMITFVEVHLDNTFGVDGLNSPNDVAISPNGLHVYTASSIDDAVAVFSRDNSTGTLTYQTAYFDDSQGGSVPSLNSARSVVVSLDGQYVIAIGSGDDAVTVFARNSTTGLLNYIEQHLDGVAGVEGINGGRYLALSTDGTNLYACSTTDDGVAVFGGPSGGVPTIITQDSISICDGDSVMIGGAFQSSAGNYSDTLTAQSGADSVIITTLEVILATTVTENVTICGADSVFLAGDWQTMAGTYYDTLATTQGCDSVLESILTVSGQVLDTVVVFDTVLTTIYDTTLITVYDTIQTFIDTMVVTVFDTVPVCDSIVFVLDTVPVFDTIPVCDTLVFDTTVTEVFDTTYVTVTDTLPFFLDSIAVTDTLIIDVVLNTGPPPDTVTVLVFPNPAHTAVSIRTGDLWLTGDYRMKVINVAGQELWSEMITQQAYSLNVQNVFGATGIYFLQVFDPTGAKIDVRKIILQ